MLEFVKIELERNQSRLVASILLQSTLATDSDCQKPFVSARIVGAVQSHGGGTEILAYDLISRGSTVIQTDIPINVSFSRSEFSGLTSSVVCNKPSIELLLLPRSSLPTRG
jgi:hypothetical protein